MIDTPTTPAPRGQRKVQLMDLWVAIIWAETINEELLGVYTSEELALNAAELVSPGQTAAEHFMLDETPEWVEGFAAEQAAKTELR